MLLPLEVAHSKGDDAGDEDEERQPVCRVQRLGADHRPGHRAENRRQRHGSLQTEEAQQSRAVAGGQDQAQIEDGVDANVDHIGRHGVLLLKKKPQTVDQGRHRWP